MFTVWLPEGVVMKFSWLAAPATIVKPVALPVTAEPLTVTDAWTVG